MANLASINKDHLHVDVEKIPKFYVPSIRKIIARHFSGQICLFIDDKSIMLNTITAHGIGLAIARAQVAPDEMIVLIINGERVELLWQYALKVSAGLLRKADDADDWQINRR